MILIIAPEYKPKGQFYELPLGLAYISAYLKSKGLEVEFMNLNETDFDVGLVRRADIILTGGLSVHYHKIRSILVKIDGINPNAKVIVGGGLFSSAPDIIHEMLSPYVDVGVVGEGEKIIYEIIAYNQYSKTFVADPIKDLDSLPFPDYEGMKLDNYLDRQRCGDEYYLYPVDKPRAMPIISSRGCPYNCSFCFHPTGKVYRQRSLDNFFSEVEYLIEKYQVNILSVLDELISTSPERLSLFCQRMKKYNIKWMTQIRVDSIDETTVKMMKDSGCFSVSIGIEHINQTILDGYHKHTTRKQIEDALALLYNNGVGIQGNILLGGPDETIDTMYEAINWTKQNSKYLINLTPVIAYPGTELFDKIKMNPKIFIAQGCPFVNFNNLPLQFPAQMKWGDFIDYKNETLSALCPHCQTRVEYPGIYWGGTGVAFTGGQSYRIGCRNCHQRFDVKWS